MVKKSIDIIGNGASNSLYQPTSDYVIACNIPQHSIKYNCLSIIDTRPLTYMRETGWRARVPIYCTQQVKEQARKLNIEGDWFDVYERKNRWNSGHHAVDYHASMAQEMHLYGFDSLFSNDLTSQCDTIIPRYARPPLNKYWHPIWDIILTNVSCKIFVHIPEGNQLAISHPNLGVLEHVY